MRKRPDNSHLQNYLAIVAIVPAILSIMAYEFLDYMLYIWLPERTDYDPITGLGILIPMAWMMELFMYFFSRHLLKKVNRLTDAINQVGNGDYNVTLDEKRMAPLTEVVSNFNKMTKQLQSVETLRSDFINDFSHEFKTPITSINGFAQLLLDTQVGPQEQQEYLQIIADESQRLSHLAQQTMMMSKLDTQTAIDHTKDFALDEQIKQNIILLSQDWSDKNIQMDVDLAPVTYNSDPTITTHIWINLLNNAIKFTPEHGKIGVHLSQDDSNIICTICDNGPGIAKDQLTYIFNKYYQTDASHSSQGMGLGLSIVARTVELCGGEITVDSIPGEGTTFTVTLPQQ